MSILKRVLLLAVVAITFSSCELDTTSTKQQMQGTWVLTQATDAQGADIIKKINFPITAFQLNNSNGMMGTVGPMFTYIVYGGSKWTSTMGKLDQAFDYANMRFDDGEFFLKEGTVNNFTVEAKLQATSSIGGGALVDILKIFGVNSSYLEQTIYHKFVNVAVEFSGKDTMIWTFNNDTQAFYNWKDSEGKLVSWGGWPTSGFQKCQFVFSRKTLKLDEIVEKAYRN